MHFKSILAVAALASSATASVLKYDPDCLMEPTAEQLAAAKDLAREEKAAKIAQGFAGRINSASAAQAVTTVPVYAHVVTTDDSKSADSSYVSESDVKAQVGVINRAYGNTTFQFSYQKTDYTTNADWSNANDELAMKKKLRVGDYKTLNLYFTKKVIASNPGVVGQCHFPGSFSQGSNNFYLDGCVVRSDALSGGQTAPHEIGHWLGLFHTFQGGCDGDGDQVDDTPACQMTHSCDESLDTCPDQPGTDMVHNLMAYGSCRTMFTPGQGTRMRSSYNKYRA